jgi:hypothetical protein
MGRGIVVAALLCCGACDDDSGSTPKTDAAPVVSGGMDASADVSANLVDASKVDVLPADASIADASIKDAAVTDGATSDAQGDTATLQPGAIVPYNYLKTVDGPFGNVDFKWFYLEDFEDHLFNVPGVSNGGGRLSSSFGASLIDSVDGDDGNPTDNRCIKAQGTCDAWWGAGSLTLKFDATVLGALPTHVGAVWTDGAGKVSFEAFDAQGASLYKFGPFSEPGFPDDTVNSSTMEDRFFGAYSPGGIGSVIISNTAGGIEIDHLQYGRQR